MFNAALRSERLFSVQAPSGVEYFPTFLVNESLDRRTLGKVVKVLSGLPGPSKYHFFVSKSFTLRMPPSGRPSGRKGKGSWRPRRASQSAKGCASKGEMRLVRRIRPHLFSRTRISLSSPAVSAVIHAFQRFSFKVFPIRRCRLSEWLAEHGNFLALSWAIAWRHCMLESNTELKLMWEMPPSGWRRVGDARKQAIEQMVAATVTILESAWAQELPGTILQKARRQVGVGVRKAVTILTLHHTQAQMADYWDNNAWYLDAVPSYWEPAESNLDAHGLSEHWLSAYRWAAAIVGLHVRDQLEDLHATHTSDESMAVLNRSVRNAVHEILLGDIWLGYHLAYWPGVMLKAKSLGRPVRIPNAAGAPGSETSAIIH